jgi:hypothetical protein
MTAMPNYIKRERAHPKKEDGTGAEASAALPAGESNLITS